MNWPQVRHDQHPSDVSPQLAIALNSSTELKNKQKSNYLRAFGLRSIHTKRHNCIFLRKPRPMISTSSPLSNTSYSTWHESASRVCDRVCVRACVRVSVSSWNFIWERELRCSLNFSRRVTRPVHTGWTLKADQLSSSSPFPQNQVGVT